MSEAIEKGKKENLPTLLKSVEVLNYPIHIHENPFKKAFRLFKGMVSSFTTIEQKEHKTIVVKKKQKAQFTTIATKSSSSTKISSLYKQTPTPTLVSTFTADAFKLKALIALGPSFLNIQDLLKAINTVPLEIFTCTDKRSQEVAISQVFSPFPGEQIHVSAKVDLEKGEKILPTNFAVKRSISPNFSPLSTQRNGFSLPSNFLQVNEEIQAKQNLIKKQFEEQSSVFIKAKKLLQIRKKLFDDKRKDFLGNFLNLSKNIVNETIALTFNQYVYEEKKGIDFFSCVHDMAFASSIDEEKFLPLDDIVKQYVLNMRFHLNKIPKEITNQWAQEQFNQYFEELFQLELSTEQAVWQRMLYLIEKDNEQLLNL
ncbi:hypothetical protein BN1013_01311 [Candidatus Rubidus massiliensis]|nr:hypothetical protein BN1013_01311 [Candidatus Rubidus massiliensis]